MKTFKKIGISLIQGLSALMVLMMLTACQEPGVSTPPAAAKPEVVHSELGEAGKSLYISKGCIGCHGPGGQSRNGAKFPALAGQNAEYLVQQLQDFKSYKRRNAMMSSVAVNLDDADMLPIATYLAELPKPE